MSTKSILVTGDIVVDCHLYGGIKTVSTSFTEPGTRYFSHLGGAVLTQKLLKAAAEVEGAKWDAARKSWEQDSAKKEAENRKRAKENRPKLPLPVKPDVLVDNPERPGAAYDVVLGIDATDLINKLPSHLHSFGVWTAHPAKKNAKARVWRMQKDFGYGPVSGIPLSPTPPDSANQDIFKQAPCEAPQVVLIDDGAILFRHIACSNAWPAFSGSGNPWIILKMCAPLCRGDLWPALIQGDGRNRLLVVLSADDLRSEDVQIRRRLSWEQCVADTLTVLREDPMIKGLLKAAHVIVNFGSAGALWVRPGRKDDEQLRLIFDPSRLEGDFVQEFEGTVYGYQTCLAAGIAHHLVCCPKKDDAAVVDEDTRIQNGIMAGLDARRRLIELGHGEVGGKGEPGFPMAQIAAAVAQSPKGFVATNVSPAVAVSSEWSILAASELLNDTQPLIGLAQLAARHGRGALAAIPSFSCGALFSVDRTEIESLSTLERLMRDYEAQKVQKKPLSIGVFGPPGAGKSFAVKALREPILGKDAPLLEFNLSQFKSPDELIGAFHRVRDAVLKGVTPIAFWDEFDSQGYKWLQYLLAPMQDGAFQEGQITHPIGKCIFVFAGGTADTLAEFGVREPTRLDEKERQQLDERSYECRREHERAWQEFKLLKGPDFISRLHGHLNVSGPNPRTDGTSACPDIAWPVRRAFMIRGVLGLNETPSGGEELDMDPGLLYALIGIPHYKHGSRSLEKILLTIAQDRQGRRFDRSALPPDPLLSRELDVRAFHDLMKQRDAFKTDGDLEAIAAAIHRKFLSEAERSALDARAKARPELEWKIHPVIRRDYEELPDDKKAANRGAARRIPDHLALIGFKVVPFAEKEDDSWKAPLATALKKHVERMAQAEHLGWCAERMANGWTYNEVRNDDRKHHHLLTDWSKLSTSDRDKDRSAIHSIPEVLSVARFKAVPVTSTTTANAMKRRRSKTTSNRHSEHSRARTGQR